MRVLSRFEKLPFRSEIRLDFVRLLSPSELVSRSKLLGPLHSVSEFWNGDEVDNFRELVIYKQVGHSLR